MSKKVFTSKTLEECLKLAASQLKVDIEKIKYEVIEEKHGFFKKKATISVEIEEKVKENNNGSIKVQDGEIIIKNPKEGGRGAYIKPCNQLKVLVDGMEIESRKEVFEDTIIELVFDENTAERRLNINISPDKMEVYITIQYIPQNVYAIKDEEESTELIPEIRVKEQIFPRTYTVEEIKEQLNLSGVKFGILEDVLKDLTELKDVDNLLIAKGEESVEGIDDLMDLRFDLEDDKKLVEDKKGRIDYKSIGHVKTVKKGDILAVRIEGRDGKDGLDVKGGIKKHKPAKKIITEAGEGCELKDENTVIASREGKPSIKGNIVSVHEVHKVDNDVDIKTGNIDFVGDVIVYGNVKEGMEVKAGHDLIVNKNVEHAKLYSKENMTVFGNVINSNLSAGGEDIAKLNKLRILENLDSAILELIGTVDHIKKFNLLGKEVHDGEIIKVLIENKFKCITPLCGDFIKKVAINANNEEKKLASALRENLIGIAPLQIKDVSELNILIKKVEKVMQLVKGSLEIPVNAKISYCQDSTVTSSGNIVITGKGEYVSKITAHGNVEFETPGSLARGGVIKAKDEIKCKKVGSEGGVSTKLIVEEKGHIWVDTAYQNTCFIIGKKEYILEVASRDIHAFLNDEGELIVDKFVL